MTAYRLDVLEPTLRRKSQKKKPPAGVLGGFCSAGHTVSNMEGWSVYELYTFLIRFWISSKYKNDI